MLAITDHILHIPLDAANEGMFSFRAWLLLANRTGKIQAPVGMDKKLHGLPVFISHPF
jgi:hypothetical protein